MEDTSETGVFSGQFLQIGVIYNPGEELTVFKCSPSDNNNNQVFTIVPSFKSMSLNQQPNGLVSLEQHDKLPPPPPLKLPPI